MNELNAEHIKKALECCTRGRKSKDDRPCLDCHYNECNLVGGTSERQTTGTCQGWLMKDALALIKELTKENKKLTINMNAYGLTAKRFAEENERLTEELAKSYKALDEQMNFYCSFTKSKVSDCPINDEIAKAKADTAREIFDEIEKIIDKHYRDHIFGNNDLEDEGKCAIIDFCGDVCVDIEKIKDKHHVTDANVGCKSPEARHETT